MRGNHSQQLTQGEKPSFIALGAAFRPGNLPNPRLGIIKLYGIIADLRGTKGCKKKNGEEEQLGGKDTAWLVRLGLDSCEEEQEGKAKA